MKALFAITLASAVFFHTALKSSLPARGSTVPSPAKVSLTFTEGVVLAQSGISILKADSSVVEKLVVKGTGDPATFEGAVTKPLAAGKYIVRWKTGSDDGHVVRGVYAFTVGTGK